MMPPVPPIAMRCVVRKGAWRQAEPQFKRQAHVADPTTMRDPLCDATWHRPMRAFIAEVSRNSHANLELLGVRRIDSPWPSREKSVGVGGGSPTSAVLMN